MSVGESIAVALAYAVAVALATFVGRLPYYHVAPEFAAVNIFSAPLK